jgi:hypothetical protein
VEVVDEDEHDAGRPCRPIVGDVERHIRRQGRLVRIVVEVDRGERLNRLRRLAVDDREVAGRESADRPAGGLVEDDDVHVHELDAAAERGML